MLEAMASGLPVFATTHGGIPEAIENGISGVLVDERRSRRPRDCADSLDSPARGNEPAGARRSGGGGGKKFDLQAQARVLEGIYLEAIGGQFSLTKNYPNEFAQAHERRLVKNAPAAWPPPGSSAVPWPVPARPRRVAL